MSEERSRSVYNFSSAIDAVQKQTVKMHRPMCPMLFIFTLLTSSAVAAPQINQPRRLPTVDLIQVLPATEDIFFGAVTDMDVHADGSVVVFDGLAHTFFSFGPAGKLERMIGRQGQGPGEIGGPDEFELTPTGDIVLVDYRNLRFSSWDRAGLHLGTIPLRTLSGGKTFWPHEFIWTSGGPYLKVSRFVPSESVRILALKDDLTAVVDTVVEFVDGVDGAASCVFCATSVLGDMGWLRLLEIRSIRFRCWTGPGGSGAAGLAMTFRRYPVRQARWTN